MAAMQNKGLVQKNRLGTNQNRQWKLIWAIIAFFPVIYLVVFTAARSDTVLYLKIFQEISTSFEELKQVVLEHESGWGFLIFEILEKKVFGNNPIIFRLILALMHILPVIIVYRKYSNNYILSVYLFIASGCHIGWMMNGLRQFLAVSIIFAATSLLIERKYIKLIIIILIASTIHSSALIMIPVIFIVHGKAWNKKTMVFIILSIIAMYIFSKNINTFDMLISNTEYAGTGAAMVAAGDDGVNPIRVLVNAIPMLLALIGKRIIDQEDDIFINICVNMSVITTGIYLVGMVTSGIMVVRLPIYVSLYNFILLPYLAEKIFTPKSKDIFIILMIIFYFLYYLYGYRGF